MTTDPLALFLGAMITSFTLLLIGVCIDWSDLFYAIKRKGVKLKRLRISKKTPMLNLIKYLELKFNSLDDSDQKHLFNRYNAMIDYLYTLEYRITYDQYSIICKDLYILSTLFIREEVFNHVMNISSLLALPEYVEKDCVERNFSNLSTSCKKGNKNRWNIIPGSIETKFGN